MKTLDSNKQTLYYALFKTNVPIYARDDEGNILYENIDGDEVAVVDSYVSSYVDPVEFKANISFNTGETKLAEYGLNEGDYDAIIQANKGELPFDEQTLIWHKTTPVVVSGGSVNPTSAEYKIVAIRTSLNEERFILKKRVESK